MGGIGVRVRRTTAAGMVVLLAIATSGCSLQQEDELRPAATTSTVPPVAADAEPVALDALGVDPTIQTRCDPMGAPRCLLPWPNDHFTVADPSSETGRRLAIDPASTPVNTDGVPMDVTDQNRADGFSPGSALVVQLSGLDPVRSNLPGLVDVGASLSDESPVVVWDATAGERVAVWAELDALAQDGQSPVMFVRPARNFSDGHHVVVGLRALRDERGDALVAPPSFAAYRDGQRSTDPTFEARRPAMEAVFAELDQAGARRADLQLAWDFTVASTGSLTGRLTGIRDAALAELGSAAPVFSVGAVTARPDPTTLRRVEGTFDVPLFLTAAGAPGGRLVLGANGVPMRQQGVFTARFRCEIPDAAAQAPVRGALYGHGLLGDLGEVSGDLTAGLRLAGVGYCATDWYGMAAEDIVQVASALRELSQFAAIPDRLQQGLLAFVWLGRLMTHPQGFAADPAFRIGDHSAFRTDQLYFDGNSQGAIVGGALAAISPDLTATVLGEAGMNYSTLLDRSVDFDEYLTLVLEPAYPDRFDRVIGMSLVQLLWDRAETNGYANHLGERRLAGTSDAPVLLLGAVGDHQVSEFALRVQARTIGAAAHQPIAANGRTVDGPRSWELDSLGVAHRGNALFVWDTGSPSSPEENVPARDGRDPHDDTPKIPEVVVLKDAFFAPQPEVVDPCGRDACRAPVPG